MLDHPLFSKVNFSTLRVGIMPGTTCPVTRMQPCVERMNMRGVTNPCGLTESGPVMTQTRYFETSITMKGCCMMPEQTATCIDANGKPQ